MDTQLLIIFIILNILNVIIQTIKSIATVKCGKAVAAPSQCNCLWSVHSGHSLHDVQSSSWMESRNCCIV